jgi:hypothetical protein
MSKNLNNTCAISILFLFLVNAGYLATLSVPLKFEHDKVDGRC